MRSLPGCRLLAVLATTTFIADAAAEAPGPRAPETGGSFVETFDGGQLDRERWYVAEGWANSPDHDCVFSSYALGLPGGRLRLEIERRPTAERDFVCGEVQSTERYGYGIYEVRMRPARGEGVISAFFTYTGPYFGDPHDEIDIELPGARPRTLETNVWVDGSDGPGATEVDLGFDATDGFRDYAFHWTPEAIRFYVDGRLVETVTDPARMPSTPGKIYLTLYSGRGGFEPWLGRFDPNGPQPVMLVDRVAYTAPGDTCQFPGSIACEAER